MRRTTDVLRGYRDGNVTPREARLILKGQGWSNDHIERLLARTEREAVLMRELAEREQRQARAKVGTHA